MEQLSIALDFIIHKKLSIILDKISEEYALERNSLDKYLSVQVVEHKTIKNENTIIKQETLVCQGKTKKGDSCTNKPKPGTEFCGKHTP